jgi:hypothetical protein
MAAILLVAIFTVHLPYGFSSIKLMAVTAAGAQFGQPGYETDVLYLACIAALALGGAGPFAVDGLIRKRIADARSESGRWGALDSPAEFVSALRRRAMKFLFPGPAASRSCCPNRRPKRHKAYEAERLPMTAESCAAIATAGPSA